MENNFSTIFDSSSSSTPQNPHLLSPMNMMMNHQYHPHEQQLVGHNHDHSSNNNKNNIDHHHHVIADEGEMENESAKGAGKKLKQGEKKSKKPRYAFQTRSQVDILDDGYRWRKYGQKAVKNNKFPRSYYRCTYQGCNVKKQIQRLSRDEEIVVTTYEGMHSHPIEKSNDNFEHILTQMQIYNSTF